MNRRLLPERALNAWSGRIWVYLVERWSLQAGVILFVTFERFSARSSKPTGRPNCIVAYRRCMKASSALRVGSAKRS